MPSLSMMKPVPSPFVSRLRARPEKNGEGSISSPMVLIVTTLTSARRAIGANDIGAACALMVGPGATGGTVFCGDCVNVGAGCVSLATGTAPTGSAAEPLPVVPAPPFGFLHATSDATSDSDASHAA